MSFALLAQLGRQAERAANPETTPTNYIWLIAGGIALLVAIIVLVILFSFLRLLIQCYFTRAGIGIFDLVGMKLRNIDYAMIVRQKIALVQSGVKIANEEMEAHYLSRGNASR